MDAYIFYGRKKIFLTQTTTKKKAMKAVLATVMKTQITHH